MKDEISYISEYVDLTPPTEDWNPFDDSFSSQEEAMMDDSYGIRPNKKYKCERKLFSIKSNEVVNDIRNRDNYKSEISTVLTTISNVYDTNAFHIN